MAIDAGAKSNPAPSLQTSPSAGAQPQSAAQQLMPIGARGAIYTVTAAQGANAADLINAGMASKVFGKITPRKLVVAAPDGPSTSGGKRARQTITLVPANGQGAAVMCGWLDVAQKAAGVRDYRSVADQHKARTGKNLDVTADEYLEIIRSLEGLLKVLKVEMTHEVVDAVQKAAQVAQNMAEPEEEEEDTKPVVLIVAGASLAVAAIVTIVLLLR